MPKPEAYQELRKIARRRSQRGYFTAAQAEACGLSRTALCRLVERGLVVRVAPGVYRFAVTAAPDWRDLLAAELLSSRGLACELTSLGLFELVKPPMKPAVLVARGGHGRGRHSTRDLAPYERVTVDGLATLAPIRAILDAIHLLPPDQRSEVVERAIVRGLVRPDQLRRRANELLHAKRPGCAITLRVLDALHPELGRARNEWEALVVRRAAELGLPRPALEYELFIGGRRYLLDAAWPEFLVALEFDGRDPHMRRRVHDYDNDRRNDLTSVGWRRFGITATALQQAEPRVFRQVAAALTAAGARLGI